MQLGHARGAAKHHSLPPPLPPPTHTLLHTQAQRLLSGARSWGTLAALQPVLGKWVAAQAAGFQIWVARQFEKEDWRPLGDEQV